MIIRDCTSISQLIELNVYVEVMQNRHPDFVKEIQTSFIVVGD